MNILYFIIFITLINLFNIKALKNDILHKVIISYIKFKFRGKWIDHPASVSSS